MSYHQSKSVFSDASAFSSTIYFVSEQQPPGAASAAGQFVLQLLCIVKCDVMIFQPVAVPPGL